MKRRPALFRSSVDRILLEVQQVMRNKDYHRGMELLERAARLEPANTNILLHLGRIYGEHNDYATAERYFEQALRVSSNRTETLALIGDHCQNFHSLKLADKYLALAVQQKDVTPEILAEQAELCERLRRMEEASELVERALDLNRNCAPALLVAVRLERQAGRLEAAEKLLVAFPENALPLIRMRACYELGTVLDRQGRYDEAMAAFTKAKWIWRPFASGRIKELAAMRTRMNELFEKATADVLKQWFDFSPQLQPHYRLALLGGHPRSGTTLLEQVLDSHPDMVSAEEFEIFLDDAYGPLLRSRFNANAKTSNFELLNTSTPAELQKSRQAYFDSMELALGQPIGALSTTTTKGTWWTVGSLGLGCLVSDVSYVSGSSTLDDRIGSSGTSFKCRELLLVNIRWESTEVIVETSSCANIWPNTKTWTYSVGSLQWTHIVHLIRDVFAIVQIIHGLTKWKTRSCLGHILEICNRLLGLKTPVTDASTNVWGLVKQISIILSVITSI